MVYYLLYIGLIGLLSGVIGTTGGGLIILLIRKVEDRALSVLLGVSAGIMAAISFLELIPEAIQEGSLISTVLGLLIGMAIIGFLDIEFPHRHFSFSKDGDKGQGRYLKTGILLSIGIALHNLPEGVAIGSSFSVSYQVGLVLAILVGIHNLPEGMAVGAALCIGGVKARKVLLITALAGVPMGLGAFLGAFFGGISTLALSLSLGFAAGAMLYIVFDELIPDAHEKAEGHSAIIGILMGIILGIVFTASL
ncbi:MAG: ZIP family metal transporter [Candidatus Thermoplasmatota archaeon]|nr:ZIP family metal transporter [Candidatus Thermoplasmatota archaeon]